MSLYMGRSLSSGQIPRSKHCCIGAFENVINMTSDTQQLVPSQALLESALIS